MIPYHRTYSCITKESVLTTILGKGNDSNL